MISAYVEIGPQVLNALLVTADVITNDAGCKILLKNISVTVS